MAALRNREDPFYDNQRLAAVCYCEAVEVLPYGISVID